MEAKPSQSQGTIGNMCRQGGGIEPLHVSMPRELKSRPSTSPTHPGRVNKIFLCVMFELPRQEAN